MSEHSFAACSMMEQVIDNNANLNNRRQMLQAMREMACNGADFSGCFLQNHLMKGEMTNAFKMCVNGLPDVPGELAEELVGLLVAVVRSVGLDIVHLTTLLRMVGGGDQWPAYSSLLMHGMAEMAKSSDNKRFFVLDGLGGLFVGGDREWAFDSGYTIDMWVWREKAGDWMDTILFRMVAGEDARMAGRGEVIVEVLLRGGQVVLGVGSGVWRQEACSHLSVPCCQWHRVCISHTPHKLRKSEAAFLVGDRKSELIPIKYPSGASFVRLYAGCFGCHVKNTNVTESHSNFKGLMGSIRVFDEPLNPSQVPSDGFAGTLPGPNTSGDVIGARHSAYPGSLGMTTLAESALPPLVPSPLLLNTTFFGGHHPFCDALDCIGQVEALVPLFGASFTMPSEQQLPSTTLQLQVEVPAGVLELIGACVEQSSDALLARGGSMLRRIVYALGFLLEQMTVEALSPSVFTSLALLVGALEDVLLRHQGRAPTQLHALLIRHIVLHEDVWRGRPAKIQRLALGLLSSVASKSPDTVRSGVGVASVLDIFRDRFGEAESKDCAGGEPISADELEDLRSSLASVCINLTCSDQPQASAAACCASVRRFLLSTPDGCNRLPALRIARRVCARWASDGLTNGWDIVLLHIMQSTRSIEGLGLGLACLVQHLVRSAPSEEAGFASGGGYALVQDLLCSRALPEDLQLSSYTLLMHLMMRTVPPAEGAAPFPPDENSKVVHEGALKVILSFLEVCGGSVRQHALSHLAAVLPSSATNRGALVKMEAWADMLLALVCGIDASSEAFVRQLRMTSLPSIVTWFISPQSRGAHVPPVLQPTSSGGKGQGAARRFEVVCEILRSVVDGCQESKDGWKVAFGCMSSLSRFMVPVELAADEDQMERLLADTARNVLIGACEGIEKRLNRPGVKQWSLVPAILKENAAGLICTVHAYTLVRFTDRERRMVQTKARARDGVSRAEHARGSLEFRDTLLHSIKRRDSRGVWLDALLVQRVLKMVADLMSKEGTPFGEELNVYSLIGGERSDQALHPTRWSRSLWHLHTAVLSENPQLFGGGMGGPKAHHDSCEGIVNFCVWACAEDSRVQARATYSIALLRDLAYKAAHEQPAESAGGDGGAQVVIKLENDYAESLLALSRYVDQEDIFSLSSGYSADGPSLDGMDESLRQLLKKEKQKTTNEKIQALKTGKEVLLAPLTQSIASLDNEWNAHKKDEEDWAEQAASQRRQKMLRAGGGQGQGDIGGDVQRSDSVQRTESVERAESGGGGGGEGSARERADSEEDGGGGGWSSYLERKIVWSSNKILAHVRVAEVQILAEEQDLVQRLFDRVELEDEREMHKGDVNMALTVNRLATTCDELRRKAAKIDKERRSAARKDREIDRHAGKDAWVRILKKHCGENALWMFTVKQHGPLFTHAQQARARSWRVDGKETGGRTRKRLKRDPRSKQYTSRAQHDAGVQAASVLPQEIARKVARKNTMTLDDAAELTKTQSLHTPKHGSSSKDPTAEDFEVVDKEEAIEEEGLSDMIRGDTSEIPEIFEAQLVTASAVCSGSFEMSQGYIAFTPDPDGGPGNHRDEPGKLERLRAKGRKMWPMQWVREVHGRRHLLRASALEIFLDGGRTLFVNFPAKGVVNEVYTRLLALRGRQHLKRNYLFDVQRELKQSELTEAWVNRKITNLEYLMQLNTLAGRSYNDLTQYPVMPWVLRDYTSESLDLNDPKYFRDLAHPIGAQTEEQRKKLRERYETFCDDAIPQFHYGTHYSTSAYVMWYLIRMEPFAASAVHLQGGRFDCPDRLFWSVADAFQNCTTTLNDVKELTPEFFSMPDFLVNSNNFDLGVTQNRGQVGDVILPPWANGSPTEFVNINRQALESEHVSANLHKWIDLIFGYKQRGRAAVDAVNVYYFLTYENSIDMNAIEDQVVRESTEAQIADYGQTPKQLFTKPHPARKPAEAVHKPTFYHPDLFSAPLCGSVYMHAGPTGGTDTGFHDDDFLRFPHDTKIMERGKVYGNVTGHTVVKKADHLEGIAFARFCGSDYVMTVSSFGELKVFDWDTNEVKDGHPFSMTMVEASLRAKLTKGRSPIQVAKGVAKSVRGLLQTGALTFDRELNVGPAGRCLGLGWQTRFAVVQQKKGVRVLLSAGHADGSVAAYSLREGVPILLQRVRMHRSAVTCMCVVGELTDMTLVTGGGDGTVRVWDLGPPTGQEAATRDWYKQPLASDPRVVLCGHQEGVTCVCASLELGVVVSASLGGTCAVHVLAKGTFVRTIEHPVRGAPIQHLTLAKGGEITMYSPKDARLHLFDINGKLLGSCSAGDAVITAMSVCQGGLALITGNAEAQVVIRCARTLYPCHTFPPFAGTGAIHALHMSLCGNFVLAGTEDGCIEILCDDTVYTRRRQQVFSDLGIDLK